MTQFWCRRQKCESWQVFLPLYYTHSMQAGLVSISLNHTRLRQHLPVLGAGMEQLRLACTQHRNRVGSFCFWYAAWSAGNVCLLVGCLTSKQHASVSQGRICSDNFTCCHTEIEVADPAFHLTPSQYTDTGPTSPSTDPLTPGAWQGSHWSANF